MSELFAGELPPCQQCGQPLGAKHDGQTITWTVRMTTDKDGFLESLEMLDGWCGSCLQDWNRRMGVPS